MALQTKPEEKIYDWLREIQQALKLLHSDLGAAGRIRALRLEIVGLQELDAELAREYGRQAQRARRDVQAAIGARIHAIAELRRDIIAAGAAPPEPAGKRRRPRKMRWR